MRTELRVTRRRGGRDWAVDAGAFLFAVAWMPVLALLMEVDSGHVAVPDWVTAVDFWLWVLGCAAVWARRRWPIETAIVLILVTTVSSSAAGAMLVALFGVAVRRGVRPAVGLGLFAVVCGVLNSYVWVDQLLPLWVNLVYGTFLSAVMCFTAIGWGLLVGARHRLIGALRDRALRAEKEAEAQAERARLVESEARLRAEQARRAERERITREMHDVLGHRLSLLSVHAGALAYRTDASREEITRTAGVIREGAHQALEDLREVIGLLRTSDDPQDPGDGRPQPTLADVRGLVADSESAGMRVDFTMDVNGSADVPGRLARSAYRIVQESLTNARKHAQGARVEVVMRGGREDGLTIDVVSGRAARTPVLPSGSGRGLIGLSERAELVGGTLEHGATGDGGFRVEAWLPWRQ